MGCSSRKQREGERRRRFRYHSAMKASHRISLPLLSLILLLSACNARGFEVWRRTRMPPAGPEAGLWVTWMGTAGVLISDGKAAILIDPFVSRHGLLTVGLGRDIPPMDDQIAAWVGKFSAEPVSAVIVSHSHYDHAMDAPYFASAFGVPILGSQSTANIARGAGLPATQVVVVESGKVYQYGDFTVRMLLSQHGPALFGRIPYPGTVDEPLTPPAPAAAYRLGAAYSIHVSHPAGSLLHHGSASWVDGMLEGIRADVVLLGVAGRAETEPYLRNVVDMVGARRLIPFHFDDFFAPMEPEIRPLLNVNLNEFFDTVEAHVPTLTVQSMPIGIPVELFAAPAPPVGAASVTDVPAP